MVKIEEIHRTSTFTWNHDTLPLLATGTVAGAVDLDFNSSSSLEIWDIFSPTDNKEPIFKASVDNRFYALAWSKPFEGRPKGLLVGAFENGVIEFWDAQVLIKSKNLKEASVFKSEKHTGDVKTLAFNPNENHILVSGGSKGEIFIWDTKNFSADPTTPGKAMTPMDEVSSVAWNNSVSHIFASTGNAGYTSIWDLKSKREVLHLAYNGDLGRANFSFVAWHPTQSTKLITASDSDSCPVILTWDLRNSNAPEKILQGHKKGVLSLDWCKQDPELLISSGKDNTTMIWNPISGVKLGEYPTTANWAFLTKFAPSAPDIFATASYDGKILVQTLQDTSPPIVAETTKNEDEFWNELSTTETTQQPVFEVKQAPSWLKRPSSVSFGFGSKLVSVKTEGGKSSVEVKKFTAQSNLKLSSGAFNKALTTNDFSEIISSKLDGEFVDDNDKSDWELLKKLSTTDKSSLFADVIKDEELVKKEEETKENDKPAANGDAGEDAKDDNSFFDKLGEESNGSTTTKESVSAGYTPSGSFKILEAGDSSDEKLIKLILANQLEDAVDECVKSGKLTEALVLALDGAPALKEKVRAAFFETKKESKLSRVIYSSSTKNITDIVVNADVSDWKLIANSITAYCTDKEDYNQKITELGDRILEADPSNRADAILCYLVGGAIDKISNIWLKELPDFEQKLLKGSDTVSTPFDAHFESLNNFAEKISAYRAISNITGSISGPAVEPICKAVLEYSNLLANYGEFEIAANFSKILPADLDGFKANSDRISKATGVSTTTTKTAPGASRYARGAQQPQLNKVASPVNKFAQPSAVAPPFTPSVPLGGSFNQASRTPSAYAKPPAAVPSTPRSQVAPAAPATPSNPYLPSQAAPTNPYAAPSNPYMKPAAPAGAPANPYAAPSNPYARQPSVSSPGASIAPPPAMPPKPSYKQVTDGWNDLPDTFKQNTDSRRAAAAAAPPTPGLAAPSSSVSSPGAPKRPSVVSPPTAPPVGPPRVLSRAPSRAALPTATPAAPATALSPQKVPHAAQSNRYAPPPGSQPSPVPGTASPYSQPPPASHTGPHAAPSNPYAPPPQAQTPVSNPYSAPPPPPFGSGSVSKLASPRTAAAQPVRNPYAPPPQAQQQFPQTNGSRAPSGGVIPPKPVVAPPPPVKGTTPLPIPPPTGPVSSSASVSSSVPPPPAATEPEKYPPGDRSHIAEDVKPIYEIFSGVLQNIKPNIPEKYTKHGEDMEKRLNFLFDHLNNDDLLSDGGKVALKEVATNLEAKNYPAASSLILSFASSFPEEIGNWHAGVKRLINMAEALQ